MREAALPVTSEAASNDMNKFMEQYLEKFYSTISSEFRKVDPNHMLLGDRYLANTMNNTDVRNMICKVAGKYLDVISYNYYTYDLDMNRIKSMSDLAGKPIIFTEFHYGDPTQGQTGGIRVLDNEDQKGKAYRNYVEKAAASGLVVGAHWFEFLDQSVTGRWFQGYEGESFGIGFINVADRPYKTMLNSVMEANYNIYDVLLGEKEPYSFDFGPGRSERNSNNTVNIQKTNSPIVIDGVKDASWPGQTISLSDKDRILGTQRTNVSSDINMAWDATNLYVFAHIKDPTPMQNAYEGFDIWNGDALEMFVGPQFLNSPGSLKVSDSQLIISAKGDYNWYNNKNPQPPVDTVTKLDEDQLGYTIEAAIPLSGININDAANGRQLRFDIGFDNGEGTNRVAQYLWNGVDGNSSNRDKWGMATLVEDVDVAPVFDPIVNQSVDEDKILNFKVSASDPNGSAVTLLADTLPNGATFDGTTGIFTWAPDFTSAGKYTVIFIASDGNMTTEANVEITVRNVAAEELAENLTNYIKGINLNKSSENLLIKQLDNVTDSVKNAKYKVALAKMKVFMAEIKILVPKIISSEQAEEVFQASLDICMAIKADAQGKDKSWVDNKVEALMEKLEQFKKDKITDAVYDQITQGMDDLIEKMN
jgi:hypothetical protein